MRLPLKKMIGLLLVIVFAMSFRSAADERHINKTVGTGASSHLGDPRIAQTPSYQGKPLSYWLKAIQDRDNETMPQAFEAIRSLGPDAWAAVPELKRVVAAPFAPIRLGIDAENVIITKLNDIETRSDAIYALASIGEAAASATMPLIEWALTVRVIPAQTSNTTEDERFVDLVGLDARYRIIVINAVEEFGEPAIPTLTRLLKSTDAERRKFAVTTLGADALPIIADLLKSSNCEDVQLGITLLSDLEPVVAKAYTVQLRRMVVCNAN